jgi:beta propeller repeat protein
MKAGIIVSIIGFFLILCIIPCTGAGPFDAYLIAKSESEKYNAIACDEGNVAWVEYGTGVGPGSNSRAVYRYNISSGRKDLVIRDTSWKRDLAFSGDCYVWTDGRGVFLYEGAKDVLKFLYSPASQYSPCIDGDTVIWVETDEHEYSLVEYDRVSGTSRNLVTSDRQLESPAISGDRVVYREAGPDNDLIVLLNITTLERTVLCDEPGPRAMPAIDGDHVVWADGRSGSYQVYFDNLATGALIQVSPSNASEVYPDISGDLVVWEDYRNSPEADSGYRRGGADIRFYDNARNITEIVAEGPFSLEFPRVSGGYIVWSGGRNDAHDIFLFPNPGNRPPGFPGKGDETSYSATPAATPSPDTKVRYYSSITDREIEWYSLEPAGNDKTISFELRWVDPGSLLSLTVVSPGGSAWHFTDTDDSRSDQAIRMTISGVDEGYLEPGKWTVAVTGNPGKYPVQYDLCWY